MSSDAAAKASLRLEFCFHCVKGVTHDGVGRTEKGTSRYVSCSRL